MAGLGLIVFAFAKWWGLGKPFTGPAMLVVIVIMGIIVNIWILSQFLTHGLGKYRLRIENK
jgi:hypothetical protein